MVFDDDLTAVEVLKEYFGSSELFDVKFCTKGLEAIKLVQGGYKADAIISEIIFNDIDGLELLELIKKEKATNCLLIYSHLKNEFLLKKANELNALYYLLKPIDNVIIEKRLIECINSNVKELDMDARLSKTLSKLLHDLGVPSHIKGYEYIREGITLLYKDPKISGITKELYPRVAGIYDTTSSRVERAIRHAIEVSWSRGDYDLMEDLFGHSVDYDRAKPTNSEFILTLADKLRLDNEIINI